jgi:hypothetical protein
MTTPLDWILLFLVFAIVVGLGARVLTAQWSEDERLGDMQDEDIETEGKRDEN